MTPRKLNDIFNISNDDKDSKIKVLIQSQSKNNCNGEILGPS